MNLALKMRPLTGLNEGEGNDRRKKREKSWLMYENQSLGESGWSREGVGRYISANSQRFNTRLKL